MIVVVAEATQEGKYGAGLLVYGVLASDSGF